MEYRREYLREYWSVLRQGPAGRLTLRGPGPHREVGAAMPRHDTWGDHMRECSCSAVNHPRRVVLTGGPGAGKTAVLEMVRQSLCQSVHVLPEAASIVFDGLSHPTVPRPVGVPRSEQSSMSSGSSRSLVRHTTPRSCSAIAAPVTAWHAGRIRSRTSGKRPEQRWRPSWRAYDCVLHLRIPKWQHGYDHVNPVRAECARRRDRCGPAGMERPPAPLRHRGDRGVLDKATRAVRFLQSELPLLRRPPRTTPWRCARHCGSRNSRRPLLPRAPQPNFVKSSYVFAETTMETPQAGPDDKLRCGSGCSSRAPPDPRVTVR